MKTLELKLKKDIFIVDTNAPIEAIEIDDYEFLCKGSELTEEIASEFFEYDDFLNCFEAYIDTVPSIDKSALKLFIKIFESKGFFWLENPIYKILVFLGNKSEIDKQIALQKQERRWQEAEEKTFRNPLIFVKK